jgi:hypothetical protein
MIGSSVSKQAARRGRAAFLLPEGIIVPESGTPPSIINFSMVSSGQMSSKIGLVLLK